MRRTSTNDSVRHGEPTVLAIGETLTAMAIALVVAVQFNTLTHIAVGGCIAPLLLLRSPDSTRLAARWFRRAVDRFAVNPDGPEQDVNITALKFGCLLLWSIIVRAVATLRHPIKGVQEVPANWKRVVLCADIRTPVDRHFPDGI